MEIMIETDGQVRCVYSEAFDLAVLGPPSIRRASSVEPGADAAWYANLATVGGPVLGPFRRRSTAVSAERVWLNQHWLHSPSSA
jgi:hypothetical protein